MVRLYESPGNRLRTRISIIILVGLILLGFWYLVFQAIAALPGMAGPGPWILSIAFLIAGFGGLYRMQRGARNRVIALDSDEQSGKAVIWLWSPIGAKRIKTELNQISNWRYKATSGSRRTRIHRILADLPNRSQPIAFDLRLAHPAPDGLRRIAPDAIADYEREAGIS